MNNNKNLIYACCTVFIWGTMTVAVKMMLDGIPVFELNAITSILAFIFLLVQNLITGSIKTIGQYTTKDYMIMIGLGFLGLFCYNMFYFIGIGQLSSQEACLLNYLWPMMIVLFSVLILKERLTLFKAIAMICSFFGVFVLMGGGTSFANANRAFGSLSCIAAAICYGLFSVLNKKYNYPQEFAMMIFWLMAGLCSIVPGLIFEEWVMITPVHWIGMLWIGIVVQAVAYLLWALALNGSENSAVIANMAYLVPLLSLILSAIVLKETLTIRVFAAFLLIIGGILLQNIFDKE